MISVLVGKVMSHFKLKQQELADVMGVPLARVKRLAGGKVQKLTREESEALVTKLRINPEWLITGEEPMVDDETDDEFADRIQVVSHMQRVVAALPLDDLGRKQLQAVMTGDPAADGEQIGRALLESARSVEAARPYPTATVNECPKCGVVYAKAARSGAAPGTLKKKSKHVSPWVVGFAVLGLMGFIYAAANIDGTRPTIRAEQREAAREAVSNSAWDGSVRQVERFLKDNLKDPKSFEAVQWFPVQKDADGYVVRVRYRARNSFGALVLEDKVFLLDRAGNVIR